MLMKDDLIMQSCRPHSLMQQNIQWSRWVKTFQKHVVRYAEMSHQSDVIGGTNDYGLGLI